MTLVDVKISQKPYSNVYILGYIASVQNVYIFDYIVSALNVYISGYIVSA